MWSWAICMYSDRQSIWLLEHATSAPFVAHKYLINSRTPKDFWVAAQIIRLVAVLQMSFSQCLISKGLLKSHRVNPTLWDLPWLGTTMSIAFEIPAKRVLSSTQLTAFQSSATYNTITSYIEVLNASVVGVKLTDAHPESLVRFLLEFYPYI